MYIRFVEITIFILLVFSVNYFVLNFYDVGTIGDRGDKGNKGLKGYLGEIGPKGYNGEQGDMGDIGDENNTATRGPVGKIGPRGDKGTQGDRGERGENGYKGNKGKAGISGPPGFTGQQGIKGDRGKPRVDNYLNFTLSDNSGYEKKVNIETKDSIEIDDYFLPNPGTEPSLDKNNSSFAKVRVGIPNAIYGKVNDNMVWDKFVTGYKLKGDSISKDRSKAYFTNIKIKNYTKL
tara:strand:+ start:133 stop:834 length:702 start_codon:yes stop_codon:yes gene_type:complete